MKRSIKQIASLAADSLTEQNARAIARKIWLELQVNKKYGQLDKLLEMIRSFQASKNSQKITEIISAEELSPAQKKIIEEKIVQKTKSQIMPVYKVDKGILGGLKIKVEDSLIDLSWTGKLQLIKVRLEGKS